MTNFEDQLRTALHDCADTVKVAPDAWDRNRQLLEPSRGRRAGRRSTWRLPLLIAAAVAVLVVGVAVALRIDDRSGIAAPPTGSDGPAPVIVGGTLSGCPKGKPDRRVTGLEILDQQDNAGYSVFLGQPSPQHPTVCLTAPRLTDAVTLAASAAQPLTLVVHRGSAPYLWGVLGRSAKELRISVDGQQYRYWGTIDDNDPTSAVPLGGGWDSGTGFAGGLPAGARVVSVEAIDATGGMLQSVRIDLAAGSVVDGNNDAQPTAVTCPAQLGEADLGRMWVPSAPVSRPDRLVPDEVPTDALACRYHHDDTTNMRKETGPLATHLSGDLRPMVDDLRWWPTALPHEDHGCGLVGWSQSDDVLLGLTYSSGETIWIAAHDPGDCYAISNGIDDSHVDRTRQILASAKAGRWLATPEWMATCPKDYSCDHLTEGRWGQQLRMVPDTPSTVTVSRSTFSDQEHPVTRSVPAAADLVDAFNRLRLVGPETGSCASRPDPENEILYSVRFSYTSGPAVLIRIITGCVPSVSNGSLTALFEGTVTPLLDRIVDG